MIDGEGDDTGWGTTFHRHFGSSAIHRDAYPEDCDRGSAGKPVYVFDPDYLAEHDAAIRAEKREVPADLERMLDEFAEAAVGFEKYAIWETRNLLKRKRNAILDAFRE